MQLQSDNSHALDSAQRFSLVGMAALLLITFAGTNLQALLWQSSDWLVGTVLPAVVVDLTNDERSDLAIAPLRRNSVLDDAAAAKARHMAENGYFAHYAPDGTTPWSFFKAEGYVYAHAGENLAIHFTDSDEVVDAWMKSPTHRKNIVDGKYTEIGVGTAKGTYDGYKTVFVVQLFGTPAVAPAEPEPVALAQAEAEPVEAVPAVIESEPTVPVTESQPASEPKPQPAPIELVADPAPAPVIPVTEPAVPITEQEPLPKSHPTEPPRLVATKFNDSVVVQTELATSSGLAVASLVEPASTSHAGATIASAATRPGLVLDGIYALVFAMVVVSLISAAVVEARRLHLVQVAYSFALLLAMGGLWYVHTLLTSGAVVV